MIGEAAFQQASSKRDESVRPSEELDKKPRFSLPSLAINIESGHNCKTPRDRKHERYK